MQMRTLILTGFVATAFSLLVLGLTVETRLPGDNQGYKPEQPIAYSHRIHAGENKIDCQFCHTAAEKGRHAAIPPASTCLKCHDQVKKDSPEIGKLRLAIQEGRPIEWVRIHRTPAFVFFNHSRHVNSNIACQTCHGEIQAMDTVEQANSLTMGECLQCHRDSNLKAVQAGQRAAAPTDCSACHY